MTDFDTVRLTEHGHVARLALNRPDKLNAVNAQVHADLRAALDAIELDPRLRAVVLTGEGRGFCSGQDLNEALAVESGPPDLGAALDRDYNPLIRRLAAFPVPVVAAVHGVAAGAGANIALACDLVVADRSAQFIQAFIRIGLVPDCGGTHFLVERLGTQRALGLMLTGEPVDGETAERLGLIYKAVEDGRAQEEALALAARIAEGPGAAIRLIRKAVRAAVSNPLDAQLDLERDLQREAGGTRDFAEGIAAFLDKRAPRFSGQ